MSAVLRLIRPERSDESLLAGFLLGRPPSTQRVYRNEVKAFLAFAGKSALVVNAADLRGYVERCRKASLRPGTIRHKVAIVKSFLAFLFGEGELAEDPMARVATPPNPAPDASRCLSGEQVAAFFARIPQHRLIGLRDRAMFVLAANCGLRLSELSRLSVADVTEGPEKGWRTIRINGKGDKIREVHARPEVWACVVEYIQRRRDDLAEDAPLFASVKRARSIRPQASTLRIPAATIYKRFKRLSRKSGLPSWASPHCLRHYFASEAHQNGANAESVRRALGHSSLSTTQRYLDRLTKGVNEAFARVKAV
jgi:integrase/recombinase XerC